MACPSILLPINGCKHTGLEAPYPNALASAYPGVKVYQDSFGAVRLTYNDQAGLLLAPNVVGKGYTVSFVYTAPSSRRMGLARSLFFVARRVIGLSVQWDSHLSKDGEALRAAVG